MCGATIAWSHARLFEPSIRTWLAYSASYLIALAVLALVSVAVFEPRTTMAEVLTLDGPPVDLIGHALPLTIAFTLATALIMGALSGRTPGRSARSSSPHRSFVVLPRTNEALIRVQWELHAPTASTSCVRRSPGLPRSDAVSLRSPDAYMRGGITFAGERV